MSVRPSVGRSVGPSVRWSVGEHESKSVKTRISAPAHPSATGGRVSGLVFSEVNKCTMETKEMDVHKPVVIMNAYKYAYEYTKIL